MYIQYLPLMTSTSCKNLHLHLHITDKQNMKDCLHLYKKCFKHTKTGTKHLSWLGVGVAISSRWFDSRPGHFGLSLGKTVYSILSQSTQLQNGYVALLRAVLRACARMLPVALTYPLGY